MDWLQRVGSLSSLASRPLHPPIQHWRAPGYTIPRPRVSLAGHTDAVPEKHFCSAVLQWKQSWPSCQTASKFHSCVMHVSMLTLLKYTQNTRMHTTIQASTSTSHTHKHTRKTAISLCAMLGNEKPTALWLDRTLLTRVIDSQPKGI